MRPAAAIAVAAAVLAVGGAGIAVGRWSAVSAPGGSDGPRHVVEPEWQGPGPFCLPVAAAAVAKAQGYDIDSATLARDVRVDPEGIAWDEMLRVLRLHGIDAQLVYPEVPGLQGLLKYGPVVVSLAGDPADHAIVVEAWDPDNARWLVMDPANPGLGEMAAGSLEPRFEESLRHTIVILPKR